MNLTLGMASSLKVRGKGKLNRKRDMDSKWRRKEAPSFKPLGKRLRTTEVTNCGNARRTRLQKLNVFGGGGVGEERRNLISWH